MLEMYFSVHQYIHPRRKRWQPHLLRPSFLGGPMVSCDLEGMQALVTKGEGLKGKMWGLLWQ